MIYPYIFIIGRSIHPDVGKFRHFAKFVELIRIPRPWRLWDNQESKESGNFVTSGLSEGFILHNGSYFFSYAIGSSIFFRLPMVLFDRSEGWARILIYMTCLRPSFVFFFLNRVNTRCGNCIPTLNTGCRALPFHTGGIAINVIIKTVSKTSTNWTTYERMLSSSLSPMQREQAEVRGKETGQSWRCVSNRN